MKDIKLLQNKILEIAIYFDKFCKEHGIVYYLMGGSALGAIRHQGFIPWDDDFDVFMTYENYQKFLEKAKKHLDTEKFYLQEENTDEWPLFFSKLRMNGTTLIEEDTKDRNMHKGIYIDIMCLNNESDNKFLAFCQYFAAKLLIAKTLAKRGYDTASASKKLAMNIAKIFIGKRGEKRLINFIRRFNSKNTKKVGHYFGKAKYGKTSFSREFLGKQRYVDFENVKLPVPEKVEEYLTVRFGDYMKLPSEEEIKKSIHSQSWDLRG